MTHSTPGPRLVIGVVAVIVTLQALMVFAFAWPGTQLGPREVPLAVAGPTSVASAVADRLGAAPGEDGEPAFSITRVADAGAAESAIRDREVYGAVVVSRSGPEVLVASAASPAVAQALTEVAAGLGGSAPVRDIVAADADDPRGAGLAGSVLPLVLTSVIGGAIVALLVVGQGAGQTLGLRLAAIGGLSIGAGLVAATVIQFGLSAIGGSYLANVGVVALLVAAVSATVAGLGSLFGRIGVGLAALTFILLGNPFSGATAAPELLPQPWGAIGQLMPPGAGVTALRSTGFFEGAGAGTAVAVLTVWLAVGLALLAAASRRRRVATAVAVESNEKHVAVPA